MPSLSHKRPIQPDTDLAEDKQRQSKGAWEEEDHCERENEKAKHDGAAEDKRSQTMTSFYNVYTKKARKRGFYMGGLL
jgi:hypothetical protein